MAGEEIAIKVDNVSKDFKLPHQRKGSVKNIFTSMFERRGRVDVQHALKGVSFEIKKGEFFGIVGRNGSGKSTMLKILAGIYQPTKGSVRVSGKLVPFIELGVGFNPELTGRENVYLNGALLGFDHKTVEKMYEEIVEFAELEQFMDQKLKNYSSGMQVRLAFSMAVRADADILLIDEVLAVGDADFQRKCYQYFKSLKRNKKTVVFVSHDMDAVREYCDSAVLIDRSELKASGSPTDVSQEYLKLFFAKDKEQKGASEKNRWGDGLAKTTKVSISVNDKIIKITQKIKAETELDSLVGGIRIRSSDGSELTGTNTKIENLELPSLKTGEDVSLSWEIPNIFSEGTYYVDPAIVHSDGVTVSDWLDEGGVFVIKKARHLPYPLDPGIKVKIET